MALRLVSPATTTIDVYKRQVEVLGSAFGGGEVKSCDPSGKDPVHFLGKGFMRIAGAESCLDMADWDFGVEGGQRAAEGGGSVALHEDDVGFLFSEDGFEGGDDTRRGLGEGLTGAHDVEVPVRGHVECVENLVEHLPVLGGHADTDIEVVRTRLHVPDDWTELNGLGAGAEDEENLYWHGIEG